MTDVILVAASGLAREVIASRPVGLTVVGVVDDAPELTGTLVGSVPVLGGLDEIARHPHAAILVCAGRGRSRRGLVARLVEFGVTADRFAIALAEGVRVPASCTIGAGSILLGGVVLTADVAVGRHVVAMPNVVLTHDDVVDDFATLCAGVVLGGSVRVGEASYLGMNSSVRERIAVGAESTLGMGAALTHDLPEGETWAGVPARPLHAHADLRRSA